MIIIIIKIITTIMAVQHCHLYVISTEDRNKITTLHAAHLTARQ
jgi:hypothetical protein